MKRYAEVFIANAILIQKRQDILLIKKASLFYFDFDEFQKMSKEEFRVHALEHAKRDRAIARMARGLHLGTTCAAVES